MNDDQTVSHSNIWHLTWPMILSNLSVPLLGLVDTAVLGHLPDASHLAAVSLGATIITFIFWAFGFLRMGTTSQIAQYHGAKQDSAIIIAQSLLIAWVLGLAIILLAPSLLAPILLMMSAPEHITPLSENYMSIRLMGAPLTLTLYVLFGIFIGQQKTKLALILTLLINISNIILDLVFVVKLGWASEGAAWATLWAEAIGVTVGMAVILRWHHLPFINAIRQWQTLLKLISLNRDLFIRTISLLFIFLFIAREGAKQGEIILAANTILLQLLSFCSYSLDGFAHCCETLVGYTVGRKNRQLFWTVCQRTTIWALVTTLILTILLFVGENLIVSNLTDIQAVRENTHNYYYWLLALPLISVWSYQMDGIFIGLSATQELRNWMLISALVFLLLWWLSQALGNHGLWLAFLCFNATRGITLILALRRTQHRVYDSLRIS